MSGSSPLRARTDRLRDAVRRLASRPLVIRTISSLALGIPAVFSVIEGGWVFSLWVALFGIAAAYEWNSIAFGVRRRPALALHLAGLAAVMTLTLAGYEGLAALAIGTTLLGAVPLARAEGLSLRWLALGTLYLLLPIQALLWLRLSTVEPAGVVLWLLAVVWATDIAAYAAGRLIGGSRLAPRLSPNKTWAGLIGGITGGALAGLVGAYLISHSLAWPLGVLGGLLAILGQLGDLTESAFKRRFGVKDSSALIPGQGGVLDRVDGLIFATVALAGFALIRGGDVLFLGVHQ